MTDTTTLRGRVFGNRYHLKRILGKGGMATVYAAEDHNFKESPKLVAVKVLNHNLRGDSDQLKKFRAEANLVSDLRNPYIVSVTDYGVTPDGIEEALNNSINRCLGSLPWASRGNSDTTRIFRGITTGSSQSCSFRRISATNNLASIYES